ncbi:MAG: trimeric autotransporter adhesin, partial [Bacteroidota bacterium]|nr:trimeric autotransporter adhesin [Bacteroidota bacterium]
PAAVQTGDTLGRIVLSGYDGSNYIEMAGIEAAAVGTVGSSRIPTEMRFYTATDASPSVWTQALIINKQQYLGIGVSNPIEKIHTNGAIAWSGASAGYSSASLIGMFDYYSKQARFLSFGDGTDRGAFQIYLATQNNGNAIIPFFIDKSGKIGINLTSTGVYGISSWLDVSLNGSADRAIGIDENPTLNAAGKILTIIAGSAKSGSSNTSGGSGQLDGGRSYGSGESGWKIRGAVANSGGSAESLNTYQTVVEILGNKLGFFGSTPVTRTSGWAVSNYTPRKTLDVSACTSDELADLVCTLADCLIGLGLIGN